jgi:hypothetical protein
MDLQVGTRIGSYTLESYLGGGSFGAVWRGRSESGERVAIKLLTGVLSSADTARMRAEVEMLAASAVASSSLHVVKVIDGGSEPLPHIVMEYIDGMDVASLLGDGGSLPISRTIDVGVALMDALRALNEAGILHRDIKPANVMIDSAGVIKLADFGIAKIVGYESITMTGQAAMTMAYAAPEIWDEDSAFGRPSHRSDLYAAGIVLYQCLTGVTPFKGNYGALYKAHAERPPDLALLPSETPPSLRSLIERCLEKRQADRPNNAAECLLILRRAYVEMRERSGALQEGEPSHFGPWRREAPHSTLPWAWRCRHETTGQIATVEVHFRETLDGGAELRRVVAASAHLTIHGAERLLGANRLLLAPNEAWQSPQPGQFQFWVAREDTLPSAAKSITLQPLKNAITTLNALIESAEREGVALALSDSLTILENGGLYLARPGLAKGDDDPSGRALAILRAQPLDAQAREFVSSSRDFAELVKAATDEDQSTRIVSLPSGAVSPAEASPTFGKPEVAPALQMQLRRLSALDSSAEYELEFHNNGEQAVTLILSSASDQDRLRIRLPDSLTLPGTSGGNLAVRVSPRRRRWLGGKRRSRFMLIASLGGGGAGAPPLTAEGEFEDQPSKAPLFAGGGIFGFAALGLLALLALGGGGGHAALDATPTATATLVPATSTSVPPTETPVPPTATAEPPTAAPDPPTPAPPPPTAIPRLVVPATSTMAPAAPPPSSTPLPPTAALLPTSTPRPTEVPVSTCVPGPGPRPGSGPAGEAVAESSAVCVAR